MRLSRAWPWFMTAVVYICVVCVSLLSPQCSECTGEPPICDCGSYCDGTSWACGSCTPIIVDSDGDGFSLTNIADGVWFDLPGIGFKRKLSWTAGGAEDGFLALDRNGNGLIDDGRELFGNFTQQPRSSSPNGFVALAEFDKIEKGGNGDGQIDVQDAVYSRLRLWMDMNHNGVSEANELFSLPQRDILGISLKYQVLPFVDEYGNRFRYRAKVESSRSTQVGKWAYDVFLLPDTGAAATARRHQHRAVLTPVASLD